MTFALDSWAVLRLLEGTEPAAGRVGRAGHHGGPPVLSWINLCEVFSIVRRDQGNAAAAIEADPQAPDARSGAPVRR